MEKYTVKLLENNPLDPKIMVQNKTKTKKNRFKLEEKYTLYTISGLIRILLCL